MLVLLLTVGAVRMAKPHGPISPRSEAQGLPTQPVVVTVTVNNDQVQITDLRVPLTVRERERDEKRTVMDSYTTRGKNWKHSFLYLTFVVTILHLVTRQSHFSRKLFLFDDETVRIKKIPDLPLRFRSDGTFKILQVADMHYGTGSITRCRDVLASEFEFCSDLNTTRFLKHVIHAENPDFIAFTGKSLISFHFIFSLTCSLSLFFCEFAVFDLFLLCVCTECLKVLPKK